MSEEGGSNAHSVCRSCKSLKRKCSRTLPKCDLCTRTGRKCDYGSAHEPKASIQDLAALQARVAELESNASQSPLAMTGTTSTPQKRTYQQSRQEGFPVAAFLDLDSFLWLRPQLTRPSVDIPADILSLLAHDNAIVDTVSTYFNNVHAWMPFISKKRIDLGLTLQKTGPDTAALFLSMQLFMPKVSNADNRHVYGLCKDFLATLESSGWISMLCLQSMVLVAIFECSQVIYPAAWMTVGACARYIALLGLSPNAAQTGVLGPANTWTEVEERKRLWWAVFFIDKFTSMSSSRPSCMPAPSTKGMLPTDDHAWDNGNVMSTGFCSVSAPFEKKLSMFATSCWAAVLIDRVQKCVEDPVSTSQDRQALSITLMNDLQEFASVIDQNKHDSRSSLFIAVPTSKFLVYSALFTLLDPYSCPEKMSREGGYEVASGSKTLGESEMQLRAVRVLENISHETLHMIEHLMSTMQNDFATIIPEQVNPFILHVVYCALANFKWLAGEGGTARYQTGIQHLESFLSFIGPHWNLAQEYLSLAKFYDVAARIQDFT